MSNSKATSDCTCAEASSAAGYCSLPGDVSSLAHSCSLRTDTWLMHVFRFTWDVIKKHRRQRAIVLTTHSMEEADVLCDRIAIMVEGRLAAVGTSLDLKSQFGVGYTLTVVKTRQPHSADAGHHIARCFACLSPLCIGLDAQVGQKLTGKESTGRCVGSINKPQGNACFCV